MARSLQKLTPQLISTKDDPALEIELDPISCIQILEPQHEYFAHAQAPNIRERQTMVSWTLYVTTFKAMVALHKLNQAVYGRESIVDAISGNN